MPVGRFSAEGEMKCIASVAGAAMAVALAAAGSAAAETYTFSAAPDQGWSPFSFSFTTPDLLSPGEPFSFTSFKVTNGDQSYLISQGSSTTLATQGNCFLFASAGETLANGAGVQCGLGTPASGDASMWFFTGAPTLPSAPGAYANEYVAIFASDSPGGQDFAGVITIAGGGGVVPEPAAWALMIGGFGLAGVALRRRRALATP
ncbi:MAG: PEPxxWA-CTERM sorting domain-containing protein [Phenylobacterium sp.]